MTCSSGFGLILSFPNHDGSLYAWGNLLDDNEPYFVKTNWSGYWQNQMDRLLQEAPNNSTTATVQLDLHRRVLQVQYDHLTEQDTRNSNNPDKIRTKVTAVDTHTGDIHIYLARRVVLTVSVGVYNHDLIEFVPPLRYPDADYNPMRIQQYIKLFYHFPCRFWPEQEDDDDSTFLDYIYTVNKSAHTSYGSHQVRSWQNLDRPDLFPGSRLLLLTLTTDDVQELFGTTTNTGAIVFTDEILSALTEPLRIAFDGDDTGDDSLIFCPHDDVTYNRYHEDRNFGYGAFSLWKQGFTVEDYFRFWGPYYHTNNRQQQSNGEEKDDARPPPCQYNGCNSNQEWILYLSGTTMCLDNWEMVTGAVDGDDFTANLVMESLGLDIGNLDTKVSCTE